MRRLRQNANMRNLWRENQLNANDLISPIFIIGGSQSIPIKTMPNISRVCLGELGKLAERAEKLGIQALALFPVVDRQAKTLEAQEAWHKQNLVAQALQILKKFNLLVFCDVALDPYTSHGHDGIIAYDRNGKACIDNELTLKALAKQALALAESGADVIAPSDMMDGRIAYLREVLDAQGFDQIAIAAYAAKFASSLYSPFRDALNVPRSAKDREPREADAKDSEEGEADAKNREKNSAPLHKKSYQIDYANSDEAMWEIALDVGEGADMLIVKPAVPYLDIVLKAKQNFAMPIICYHVSGEYAAIASAAKDGCINEKDVVLEQLTACKRAGASAIISYYAPKVAEWLKQ